MSAIQRSISLINQRRVEEAITTKDTDCEEDT
jgi:hypothetical protein